MPNRIVECGKAGNCSEQTTALPDSIIKQAQPYLQLGAMAVGIVIWSFSTFALKETVADLKAVIATQRQEMMSYSDNNRKRVEDKIDIILAEIRDQLSYIRALTIKRGKEE